MARTKYSNIISFNPDAFQSGGNCLHTVLITWATSGPWPETDPISLYESHATDVAGDRFRDRAYYSLYRDIAAAAEALQTLAMDNVEAARIGKAAAEEVHRRYGAAAVESILAEPIRRVARGQLAMVAS